MSQFQRSGLEAGQPTSKALAGGETRFKYHARTRRPTSPQFRAILADGNRAMACHLASRCHMMPASVGAPQGVRRRIVLHTIRGQCFQPRWTEYDHRENPKIRRVPAGTHQTQLGGSRWRKGGSMCPEDSKGIAPEYASNR